MRAETGKICGIYIGIIGLHLTLAMIAGGLWFTAHEADMVHLIDIILRMSAVAVPHLDFMTPIGEWAMRPMALLHGAGLSLGMALIGAQILVAALLLPPTLWAAVSRLTFWQSMVFGLIVFGLCAGVVAGGVEPNLSLSMHYNRWAWAMAGIVMILSILPARGAGHAGADALSIGLLMACLGMIKITFAVALAPVVILALFLKREVKTLILALLTSFVVLILVTLEHGLAYWFAYIDDLQSVVGSANRPMPSDPLPALFLSPANTPASVLMIGLVLWLRRQRDRAQATPLALLLLLSFPALTFVTWQNYGNDPIWLGFWALILWGLAGQRAGVNRMVLGGTAAAMALLILPVMGNILYSPLRHVSQPKPLFRPLLPHEAGVRMVAARAGGAWVQNTLITPPDTQEGQIFQGAPLPECELQAGLITVIEAQIKTLQSIETPPKVQPFVADLFAPHWLFSDLEPLPGGTPWYYDGLPGIENASHLLVPNCAADPQARAHILTLIDQAGIALTPAGETPLYRLYELR
jgi:hypothetical protein